MNAKKQNKTTHTITVQKGCKNGIDYVNIWINGIEKPYDYELGRTLTGCTSESQYGVFTLDTTPQEIVLWYGKQNTRLNTLLPPEQTGNAGILSYDQDMDTFVSKLRTRILVVQAWVNDQDFELVRSFEV